ncbi:MAG: Hsp20/alpha crystallin family protein [Verrucomicrobiota bacterium]|nr:Hsp20/alpha crystallin family protein [Verrucomicrobiota bacterium]
MKLVRYEYPTVSHINALNELFQRALTDFQGWPGYESSIAGRKAFVPAVDVYEDTEAYHARFELPGFKRENLNVELENAVLTVSSTTEPDTTKAVVSFSRSLSVPEGIDADKVKAKYEDGILTVTLPKSERRKPKAIEVK